MHSDTNTIISARSKSLVSHLAAKLFGPRRNSAFLRTLQTSLISIYQLPNVCTHTGVIKKTQLCVYRLRKQNMQSQFSVNLKGVQWTVFTMCSSRGPVGRAVLLLVMKHYDVPSLRGGHAQADLDSYSMLIDNA